MADNECEPENLDSSGDSAPSESAAGDSQAGQSPAGSRDSDSVYSPRGPAFPGMTMVTFDALSDDEDTRAATPQGDVETEVHPAVDDPLPARGDYETTVSPVLPDTLGTEETVIGGVTASFGSSDSMAKEGALLAMDGQEVSSEDIRSAKPTSSQGNDN